MPKHGYDTDEVSSSEEDVGPSCHVARKRRKGGNVSWASGPEPPSFSSDDEVVVRPKRATGRAVPKPEVVPNQRIEALESSFNTLVENNSLLMEQNKLLKAQMADLEDRVVSKNSNPVGRVITKVEPVAARLSPKTFELHQFLAALRRTNRTIDSR